MTVWLSTGQHVRKPDQLQFSLRLDGTCTCWRSTLTMRLDIILRLHAASVFADRVLRGEQDRAAAAVGAVARQGALPLR